MNTVKDIYRISIIGLTLISALASLYISHAWKRKYARKRQSLNLSKAEIQTAER